MKIYNSTTSVKRFKPGFRVIIIIAFFVAFAAFINTASAQISLTATSGITTGNYSNLTEAFDAINSGSHKGDIIINITANTNEGTSPATLNSSNADPAGYTSVLIQPIGNNIVVSGDPGAGFGVIQLNGADYVSINGDNPNVGGQNRNLTISNTGAATDVAGSCIRIATSSVVSTADHISILNCILDGNVSGGNSAAITSGTGSSAISFGIYVGGNAAAIKTAPPLAVTTSIETAPAGVSIDSFVVQNNAVNNCARAIVFNAANATVSDRLKITQNLIGTTAALGGFPYTAPASTVYAYGIWVAGTSELTITDNDIHNIISYAATGISAIELNANITGNVVISGNTISAVASNTGTNITTGINLNGHNGSYNIVENVINTIDNDGASIASPAAAIRINSALATGTIASNKIAGVYNRGGGPAQGIGLIATGNSISINNNFISGVLNDGSLGFGNNSNANGILLNSGIDHRVYYNSINLYGANGASSTNSINCLAITSSTQTGLDIRNNIFSNKVTGGGASNAHVCVFMPFAPSASMNLTLNNNGYYASNTAGLHGVAFAGVAAYNAANIYTVGNFNPLTTAGANNFRNFSAALGDGSNDFASFGTTAAAPFVSATDLHIPAGPATQLESGGTPVNELSDIDNTVRNATFPDIGADEFAGTKLDNTPPLINYNPLNNDCTLGNRQLVATITDPSGVPTSGLGIPRLYWRINLGAYTGEDAVWLGGNNFQFTFGAGAVLGDAVSYYIVAQDGDAIPNITSSPAAGAAGFTANPPAASTDPTSPETYTVTGTLAAGVYTVGGGGDYPTITAAINDYNNSCLGGAIIVKLIDASYPAETFPIVIGNTAASATNTLTIEPNTGVAVAVSGNHASTLFKFNGADYVTFDGLNTGGSSLTITNINASGSVFWMATGTASNAATHNNIQNCNIKGGGTTGTGYGIISGNGTFMNISASAPNSNNSISNCTFKSLQDGIFINGNTVLQDDGWLISGNTFGSAVAADKLGYRAITLQWVDNFTVTGNTINGVTRNSASAGTHVSGIAIYNAATNGVISKNKISDIAQGGTLAGSHGLILQSSSNASNIAVNNNFIWDIKAVGSPTVSNTAAGILVATGGGYNIYFNSVSLTGGLITTTADITAAMRISATVTTPNALNIRNNIFSDLASFGPKYCIYNASDASIFGTINNNDYYFTGALGSLAFLAGNITSLPAWQALTADDVRSLITNPLFVSATDLHLQSTSPLNALAVTLSGLTTDIDNNTRAANPDIGADENDAADCSGTPTGGTIAVSVITLCNSGSALLTGSGFSGGDGISYQWQSSIDNFASAPTNLAGQTIPSNANTGTINVTTYFRLAVTCSNGGATGYSNVVSITVNNPAVLTTTGASRCGTGTLTISATASAGSNLNWYAAATGGVSLQFGASYTPTIAATTTYYVEASTSTNITGVGPLTPTTEGGSIGVQTADWNVYFDVLQATTLQTVDIFPNISGVNGNIIVRNAAGVQLINVPYTTNVSGGATAQRITVGVILTPGSGYYIEGGGSVPSLSRNESGATYPYTSSVANITGNGFDNTYYMCYYNLRFSSTCFSARTAVTAVVNAAPAITVTATPTDICAGSSTSLHVASSNLGYSFVWVPGNLPGATVVVSPATTTTYTVTATDNTGGPNTGCALKGSVTVNVRQVPTAVTVTPPTATVCINSTATQLTASGGILSNISALNENFNSNSNGWTVSNNSVGGAFPGNPVWTLRPNGYIYNSFTFNSNDASQFYLSNSYSQGTGSSTSTYLRSPAFSLTGFSTANLSFWHYYRYNSGETAVVEASTDNINWIPLPLGTYTSTQGSANAFVNATLNMDAYAGQPVVYIRFNNEATWDWWWAVDNVNVTGNVNTTMTWTQAPVAPNSIFTDASASLPYTTGSSINSVYVQPGLNTVYTATATSPLAGACTATSTSTITVTPAVSVTITASANPACPGATIDFASTVINGGPNPIYQWQVNNANILGATGPTYSNNSLTSGDVVTVIVIGNGSCTYGNPATSNPITMSVAPPSGVALTITVSPGTEVCLGMPVTFTATPTNGGLTPSYQWKVNGLNAGTNSATFVTTTLNNGDVVTCFITSNSPCISGIPTATSNQLLITVNPYGNTAVVIGTTLGSNTVCIGTQVTVRATPTRQGHAPIYEYFLNNISQGQQSSNDFIFTPANGDKVRVKLTSNYTCLTGPDTAKSNTITMVVLNSAPADVALAASATLCTGSPITFTATPTNGGIPPKYAFHVNGVDVLQDSSLSTYVLANPVNGNTVQVFMLSSFTCVTGNPASSPLYTVALNQSPSVTASIDCSTILSGSGQQATLTAVASAGSGTITTYQWILNGTTNVGTNSPTYTTTVAGSYTVKVTNSNGCSFTTSATPLVLSNGTAPLAAGTYMIPFTGCSGFDKISSAVNYINTYGVSGPGAVIFNITPGYTETAPVGGYNITATGTATNSIVFQRNGPGNKPVITAGLQVAGSNNDGIFKIVGGDYITIKDLLLRENPANTATAAGATNTMTEWAVAMLYASTTNGPNNNTIQDDSISLNKSYPNSFGIYSNLRHNATAVATNADITNATSGSNKIYSNAISNVNVPLFFLSAGVMSAANDIGGSSVATANSITDWGSNTAANAGNLMFGVTSTATGIYAANQTGLNISWNNISNATGIDAGAAGLHGILNDFVGSAPTGTFTNSITNNTISLNSSGTTGIFEAISQSNTVASTAVPGFTLNINNNAISSTLNGVASASSISAIANAFPSGVLSISDNIFRGNASSATTGGFSGIVNSAAVATTITVNNNQFGDVATDAVHFSAATNGTVSGIRVTNAAATANLTINGNSFTRFVHTVAGTSPHNYISVSAGQLNAESINNNTFSNITTNSTGDLNAIVGSLNASNKSINGNSFISLACGPNIKLIETGGGTTTCTINNNNIGNNMANSITGSGTIFGILVNLDGLGVPTLSANNITGLSSTGGNVSGIRLGRGATITGNTISLLTSSAATFSVKGVDVLLGGISDINSNIINNLTATGTGNTTVSGIDINAGTISVSKNKLYSFEQSVSTAGTSALVNGILVSGNANVTAFNNFISDLKAPVANSIDAIHGISLRSTAATTTLNIYYNSIYLNASSTGTDFGTSAIFHTGSSTASTAVLNLRNNILANESVSSGAGLSVALRNANTDISNYASSSNNNLFFAGSLATPGPLYYDGTNTEITIAGLQARLATRESASITARPLFVSTTDLHIVTTDNCGLDGAAAPITGITDDIDANSRNAVTPDIGADEFDGTGGGLGIWKGVNTNWMDPDNWCGQVPTSTMNVTIPAGRSFYPVITTSSPVTKNVTIAAGGSVIISGAGSLGIYGVISNAGIFDVADGTIIMMGSTAQTIPAGAFQNNDLKNLIISNTAAAPSVSLAGPLNLIGKLSFTGNNKTFATNDNLTLRSTATGTASVGDLTSNNVANNNNQVTGNVTTERFITARRAWRFLSVPTQNNLQNIHQAWQENQLPGAATPAGFGIQITSH